MYSYILKKIYESSSKALNTENECDKIRNLYELLLDINFESSILQNKKDIIMKLKDNLLKTKDYDEMEKNIKKIFKDYIILLKNTTFFKFSIVFFLKKSIFY